MKIKLVLKRRFTIIAEGILEVSAGAHGIGDTSEPEVYDKHQIATFLFSVEQAINGHSQLRAHLDLIEDAK